MAVSVPPASVPAASVKAPVACDRPPRLSVPAPALAKAFVPAVRVLESVSVVSATGASVPPPVLSVSPRLPNPAIEAVVSSVPPVNRICPAVKVAGAVPSAAAAAIESVPAVRLVMPA